jgi:hypothetical protein
MKPIGVPKKFCMLDWTGSSHGPRDEDCVITAVDECATHGMAFDNLGDESSPDIRGALSPRVTRKCLCRLHRLCLVSLFFILSFCYIEI